MTLRRSAKQLANELHELDTYYQVETMAEWIKEAFEEVRAEALEEAAKLFEQDNGNLFERTWGPLASKAIRILANAEPTT